MRRSPPRSSPRSGGWSSPISTIRPSAAASQPRSTTRSASTIWALVRMQSDWELLIAFSRGGRELGQVHDGVGDAFANGLVVNDGHDGCAAFLLFSDQACNHRTVLGIERGGRLVQEQDRPLRQKSAGDVDPLLFPAGEGCRRQALQGVGNVKSLQQIGRTRSGAVARRAVAEQRLGND